MAKSGGRPRQGHARRALIGVAAMAAVLAAVAVVGPLLVPSGKLAPRAAEALSAATGSEVTIGSARLTLLGGPGLALRDVQVGSSAESGAVLEEVAASLAVWPLLRREVVVDHVSACGPALRLAWRGQTVELGGFSLDARGLNLVVARPGAPPGAGLAGPGLPPDLTARVSLQAASGVWSRLELADITVDARLEGRDLTVRSIAAACGDGRILLSGAVVTGGPVPLLRDGQATLQGIQAGALLGALVPEVAAQLEVRLDGTLTAAGPLGGTGLLSDLNAEVHLGLADGLVRAGPWLAEAASYLGPRQDLVDIRIDRGRLAARLEAGRCLIDTLATTGPDTDWEVRGSIGLPNAAKPEGAVDLAVHVRLPAGFTPELGAMTIFAEALRDTERRINLDLRVQGPLPEATVTLDLAAMSRRARGS